jgi:hypothetical protein
MSISPNLTIEKLAYTLEEATEIGLPCRSRIYELAATGKIRLVKDGKRTLVLADEAWRYLTSLPTAEIGGQRDRDQHRPAATEPTAAGSRAPSGRPLAIPNRIPDKRAA